MAASKRQRQPNTANRQASAAGQPTISVRAERTEQSLAAERQALMMRRARLAGAIALPVVLILGLLLYFRPFARPSADAPASAAPLVQPTAAAAPLVQPTAAAAPLVQPTATAAAQPQPTAAPAAAVQQPAAGAIACEAIAGAPVFSGATCVKHDLDNDDGVIKAENSYTTATAADEVRRFYEDAFAKNGWAVQEFEYDITLGARRLKIQADTDQGASGVFTKIKLTEYGAPAGARTTCAAIEGLPVFTNATCADFDTDTEDGVLKAENSYTTSASPEEVHRFYASALAQNGWAGQDFTYEIAQGARALKVTVDTETAAGGAMTEIKIGEK
jgi:hypothetical protein